MALTSIDSALTQYRENSVYEGSVTKTQNFVEAIRYLLVHRPTSSAHGPVNFSWASLEKQEEKAAQHLEKIMPRSSFRTNFTKGVVRR